MKNRNIVLAYITTKDKAEALKLGEALVQKRVAACVNIIPGMISIYRWKGKQEKGREVVLIAKTHSSKKRTLLAVIKKHHSYSCPCVLFIKVAGGNPDYFSWLEENLR